MPQEWQEAGTVRNFGTLFNARPNPCQRRYA